MPLWMSFQLFSLSFIISMKPAVVPVGCTRTRPWTREGCSIEKRQAIFAPAPSPKITACGIFSRSRILISSPAISSNEGYFLSTAREIRVFVSNDQRTRYSIARGLAASSCPGKSTWTQTMRCLLERKSFLHANERSVRLTEHASQVERWIRWTQNLGEREGETSSSANNEQRDRLRLQPMSWMVMT